MVVVERWMVALVHDVDSTFMHITITVMNYVTGVICGFFYWCTPNMLGR